MIVTSWSRTCSVWLTRTTHIYCTGWSSAPGDLVDFGPWHRHVHVLRRARHVVDLRDVVDDLSCRVERHADVVSTPSKPSGWRTPWLLHRNRHMQLPRRPELACWELRKWLEASQAAESWSRGGRCCGPPLALGSPRRAAAVTKGKKSYHSSCQASRCMQLQPHS